MKHANRIITFLILFCIFFLLIFFSSFTHVRSILTDNLYGGNEVLDNIVIISIDDYSINKIGRWPWDRDVFARILIDIDNPRAIGMDLSFFEESEDDVQLREQIRSIDNLVLAAEINDHQLFKPIFDAEYGYVNFKADPDGIIRKFDATLSTEVSPFAVAVYRKSFDESFVPKNKELVINFANKPGSFTTRTAYEVLNKKIDFTDKIVLIGATAPNLHDNFFVPTSNGIAMNGVEIHASVLQNLILNNFLVKQGSSSIIILVALVGMLGMFILSRLRVYYSILIVPTIVLIYAFLSIFIFDSFNYVLDLLFFPMALIVFTGSGIGINYLEQKKHSAFLTGAFGKYISKDLLAEIIDRNSELKLGGGKRVITIFFSDVRGFTSISEKLKPEQLVHLLNEYLTKMTKIILDNKGTVDKFIGDAVMAFWNAPVIEKDHEKLACETAATQIKTLVGLREEWKKQDFPEIRIGIGIHTGEAIIGNMGSEDRFDYTAMGDTINLGSRLEGLTKQYGVEIIVSESTFDKVKKDFKFRKLDMVKVKGKKIPVVIYELITIYDENFVGSYEKALELYLESNFKEALQEFENALSIKFKDISCKLFIHRCKAYILDPPVGDWDGAFEFKTK